MPSRPNPPSDSLAGLVPLAAVLVPFAAFALAYSRLTPLGMGPDEPSHLGYIHGIVAHVALPSATTPEKQQPPLYYLVGAVVYALTGDDQLVRLTSVVFGLAALSVIWLVARRLFPAWHWRAALAVGLVAALPEFQYLSGVVTDDSLAWLVGSLVVLLIVVSIQTDRVGRGLLVGAGAVIGVALLSKETVWLPAAVLGLLLAWRCLREGRPAQLAWLTVLPLLISGWWFARNLAAFHSLVPPLAPLGPQPQHLDSIAQVRAWVSLNLLSTVGLYGVGIGSIPLRILGRFPLPSVLVGAAAVLLALAVAGWAAGRWPAWDRQNRLIAGLLSLFAALVLLQSVVNSILLNDQPQGRYLLVVAAIPTVAVTRSLSGRGRRLTIATGLLLAALGALALVLDVSGLLTAASLS